ncbi:hypothetical protein KOM00_12345 [Geomonas sp. Red69]|uniref:Uncharacterized protein n=1 Tax=Geomonas diazotrophica TaxID=2843197 RepID=A0ABX8JVC3_9BACT|nr:MULTISPECIES: hypothetical protein [Geomonas]MBU5637518.1 hypothetical protein [Geomonas diazotrophica]QWV99360.1 hypothetical protein KP005_08820 [Geomonas nitrogeniifigens]QXE88528.1 hypothetical protein KP003_09075 [Geomonas nitrogeniifigens]
MLKKLAILVCLASFAPAAAGAQEVAPLLNQPAQQAAPMQKSVNLMPREEREATVVAVNDAQGTTQGATEERPRKSHSGLTFKEFCDVHFGEYRWVYWVGAVAAIVAIHVVAAD